jgi:hypothetical protein
MSLRSDAPLRRGAAVLIAAALCGSGLAGVSHASPAPTPEPQPYVVVATIDTGTNPFHPVWRRNQSRHPSTFIAGYPRSAKAVRLTFRPTFVASVAASREALRGFKGGALTWIPGTNIIGAWAHPTDKLPVFDATTTQEPSHSHGASASSQIAGRGTGMSPDAWLVVMDRTADKGADVYRANADALRWAADQSWIDIIHTNIQNSVPLADETDPVANGYPEAVEYAVSKGKIVVSAAGNYFAEPSETSPHAGPPGVFAAGADDNCGYADYSNLDPHVVMDGEGTVAADPVGFGTVPFGGTSSASPRVTGYIAELLLRIRRQVGQRTGMVGNALVVAPPSRRPKTGPLADGTLTAAELLEVVRKTADPRPHASKYDGTSSGTCVPDAGSGPAFYPKMGYGEVSEHTLPTALAVLTGQAPMPSRPVEDNFYAASEAARAAFWN